MIKVEFALLLNQMKISNQRCILLETNPLDTFIGATSRQQQ